MKTNQDEFLKMPDQQTINGMVFRKALLASDGFIYATNSHNRQDVGGVFETEVNLRFVYIEKSDV